MTWTLPNILTVLRIAAAPALALAYLLAERPAADWIAFAIFAGAALTDFLDGWLARRLGQVSAVGTMLDPIADKAMVMVALAVLTGLYGLEGWLLIPVVVILVREVLISGLREYLGDARLPVSFLAKIKTTLQMLAIGALLMNAATEDGIRDWLAALPPIAADDPVRAAKAFDRFLWRTAVDGLGAAAVGLLWAAAILTAITGWDYLARGIDYIRFRERRGQ